MTIAQAHSNGASETAVSGSSGVLILNQSYEPISVCSGKKALLLILLTKAELIAARDGQCVRSVSLCLPLPAVIRLSSYYKVPFRHIELTRKNIFKRDEHKCQYCGKRSSDMTIDHVLPRSRGGEDTWYNLVTACKSCNSKKGNKTPDEARMPLINRPKKPSRISFFKQFTGSFDDSWRPFLFMD